MKKKQIHRCRKKNYVTKGREMGEGRIGSLGLLEANYYT